MDDSSTVIDKIEPLLRSKSTNFDGYMKSKIFKSLLWGEGVTFQRYSAEATKALERSNDQRSDRGKA